MGRTCTIRGCRSGYKKTLRKENAKRVSIFRFPKDPILRKQWATKIGRQVENVTDNMGICALHFAPDVRMRRVKGKFSPAESPTLSLGTPKLNDFIDDTGITKENEKDGERESLEAGCDSLIMVGRVENQETLEEFDFSVKTETTESQPNDTIELKMENNFDNLEEKVNPLTDPLINPLKDVFDHSSRVNAMNDCTIPSLFAKEKKNSENHGDFNYQFIINNPFDENNHADMSKSKSNQCPTCNLYFSTKADLLAHSKEHNSKSYFLCEICGYKFMTLAAFKMHKKKHNMKNRTCNYCGVQFNQPADLKYHILSQHTPINHRPFKCKICNSFFIYKSHYNTHMRTHTIEKPHKCKDCGKGFIESFIFEIHKRIHSGVKPFICEFCGESFISNFRMKIHAKQKHSDHISQTPSESKYSNRKKRYNLFKCDLCNKSYPMMWRYFEYHIHRHLGLKAFNENGHIGFRDETMNKVIKTFQCERCPKSYARKKLLYDHMNVVHYKGEKHFQCSDCGKKFHTKVYLRKHRKFQHSTNIIRYDCKICGLSYSTRSNLRVHERIHTGDIFTCDQCPKFYTEKRALVKHRCTVHGL